MSRHGTAQRIGKILRARGFKNADGRFGTDGIAALITLERSIVLSSGLIGLLEEA
jgi:hypothetical protein